MTGKRAKIAVALGVCFCVCVMGRASGQMGTFLSKFEGELLDSLQDRICMEMTPVLMCVDRPSYVLSWPVDNQMNLIMPIYGYISEDIGINLGDNPMLKYCSIESLAENNRIEKEQDERDEKEDTGGHTEQASEYIREGVEGAEVVSENGNSEEIEKDEEKELQENWKENVTMDSLQGQRMNDYDSYFMTSEGREKLSELLREENEEAKRNLADVFSPHVQQAILNPGDFIDFDTLVQSFYIVDENTMVGSNQLNVTEFLAKNMTIQKNDEVPQILIYHTHSKEGYVDSTEGESEESIVGVGEYLAQILRDTYGYNVLHHTESYDEQSRDDAYSKALSGVEKLLKENPTIEVVIDLHRDEVAADKKLVIDLDGKPTAKFMFFNGLSRTKKTGNIDYLYNENLNENLAFSFQMQWKAAEYYPGLTRKIYLKGYRYNMHLKDKYLLIELGAQNNTLEEAMNACNPLAHILDMVLSGT